MFQTEKFAHHVYTESRVAVIGTDKDDTFFRSQTDFDLLY